MSDTLTVEGGWASLLVDHLGSPLGSQVTRRGEFEVLTEAGYTTADCDVCRSTVTGDVDPMVVARVLDTHACVPAADVLVGGSR